MVHPEYWRRGLVYPRTRLRAVWSPKRSRRQKEEFAWPPSAESKSVADSGSGSDGATLYVAISPSDTGSGADAVPVVAASVPTVDAGSGLTGIDVVKESSFPVPCWHRLQRTRRTKYLKQMT